MRALSPTTPTYVFPAMNTCMYEHPLTAEHLRVVRDVVKYNVVGPIGKQLACGDIGLSDSDHRKISLILFRYWCHDGVEGHCHLGS